jgi:hypothetical protein
MPVNDGSKSPFFRPKEKPDFSRTPGGTQQRRKKAKGEAENKSTIAGCTANIINAIVGAGIVGLPYAIRQTGFISGITLIIFCGLMTDKSLRLLVETAKHAHVPSYETVAEAAFGRFGFLFVAINMFVMSYGAMLSYLMIVKDSFSAVFGVAPDNFPMKRAILFLISITIIVPLSSQRVRIRIRMLIMKRKKFCNHTHTCNSTTYSYASTLFFLHSGYGRFVQNITNQCRF